MLTWLLSLIFSLFISEPTPPATPPKFDASSFQTEIQSTTNNGKPGEKTIIIDDYIIN